MKNLLLILLLGFTSHALSSINIFTIKLDEFTLKESDKSINDTIEVTRAAWLSSDSIHVSVFISKGLSQKGRMCSFIARDTDQLLFESQKCSKILSTTLVLLFVFVSIVSKY